MKKLLLLIALVIMVSASVGFLLGRSWEKTTIINRVNQLPVDRDCYTQSDLDFIIFAESQL